MSTTKTPQQFINQYNGKWVDYDGVYGAQCVDAYKIFCAWIGAPVKPTLTGWADGYWYNRNTQGYSKYFDFISNTNDLKAGDWLFWARGSTCKDSHVGMFVSYAGSGYANVFSENQGGNAGFRTVKLKLDILGAFRWKEWTKGIPTATTPSATISATGVAYSYDTKYAKTYYATDALNCRNSGSKSAKILGIIPKNTQVTCYGYYTAKDGYNWLYAQALVGKALYTGFFADKYLSTSTTGSKTLAVGSKIKIKSGAKQYGKNVGFASKVYNTTYTVSEINGDRVVFKSGAVVMGAANKSDCIVQ